MTVDIVTRAARARFNSSAGDGAWERLSEPQKLAHVRHMRAAIAEVRAAVASELLAERSLYAEPNGINPQEDGEYVALTRAAAITTEVLEGAQ